MWISLENSNFTFQSVKVNVITAQNTEYHACVPFLSNDLKYIFKTLLHFTHAMQAHISAAVCFVLLCWHTQSRLIIKFIFKFLHQTLFTFFRSNVGCQRERARDRESEKKQTARSLLLQMLSNSVLSSSSTPSPLMLPLSKVRRVIFQRYME